MGQEIRELREELAAERARVTDLEEELESLRERVDTLRKAAIERAHLKTELDAEINKRKRSEAELERWKEVVS